MTTNIKTVSEIKEILNLTICELAQIDLDNWLTPLRWDQEAKLKEAIALLNEVDESLQEEEKIRTADINTVDLLLEACQQ